jgi:hypothetical protein
MKWEFSAKSEQHCSSQEIAPPFQRIPSANGRAKFHCIYISICLQNVSFAVQRLVMNAEAHVIDLREYGFDH